MKRIAVQNLKEGMRYSSNIYFDDGKYMLLSAGTPISNYELHALVTWKIPYVKTEGRLLLEDEEFEDEAMKLEDFEEVEEFEEFTDFDENDFAYTMSEGEAGEKAAKTKALKDFLLNLPDFLLEGEAYIEYKAVIKVLNEIFVWLKNSKEENAVNSTHINSIAERVKKLASGNSTECVSFILSGRHDKDDMACEAVNIAMLSVIITDFLNLNAERQMDIVVGALLHDIGMMSIPKAILSKQTSLTEAERQTVMAHTVYAYKSVTNLNYPQSVRRSVMEHHERWDGKGYPSGLSGTDIDIGARVIAAADAFVAMLNPRTYRAPILGYQAMKNLLADNARRFDPNIIKAIIQSVGIYPIGSIVMLNDSSIARVIKTSLEAPLRPIVEIILDRKGNIIEEKERVALDLKGEKMLFIVKAIDPSTYEHTPKAS